MLIYLQNDNLLLLLILNKLFIMKNLILKFKQTPEYEVLTEIFKLKRLAYAALLNVAGFATMYGLLELYLIFKYGY